MYNHKTTTADLKDYGFSWHLPYFFSLLVSSVLRGNTALFLSRGLVCIFWASLIAHLVENPPAMQETSVQFLGWEERLPTPVFLGFPFGSASKESACNAEELDLIPGLGRSAGEGKGYPLQYSWASLLAQLVKNQPAIQKNWI